MEGRTGLGPYQDTAAEALDHIVQARRSVRLYDADAPWDPEAVTRSLERALLSPTSSNLQLWEFHRIQSKEALEAFAKICLNQNAAATARELVVVVARQDRWRKHRDQIMADLAPKLPSLPESRQKQVKAYYGKLIPLLYTNDPLGILGWARATMQWALGFKGPSFREATKQDIRVSVHRSAALAAQTFMLSMKAEGYDTCPMEGFDSKRAARYLKLPWGAEPSFVIACGPGKPEGIYGERFRVPSRQQIQSW